jgi:hypothetical protein
MLNHYNIRYNVRSDKCVKLKIFKMFEQCIYLSLTLASRLYISLYRRCFALVANNDLMLLFIAMKYSSCAIAHVVVREDAAKLAPIFDLGL